MRPAPSNLLILLLAIAGWSCSASRGDVPTEDIASWPYAGIQTRGTVPLELKDLPLFQGRWLERIPRTDLVLTETTDPRYVVALPFAAPRNVTFYDFGIGAQIETLAFMDRGRTAVFVGTVGSPYRGNAALARALLEFDLEHGFLVRHVPLRRDEFCRGFAIDGYSRQGVLLTDVGGGQGVLRTVDMDAARYLAEADVGSIPARVERRGVAMGQNGEYVFCLSGGLAARSDFAPVDLPEPAGPGVLVFRREGLQTEGRIPLDPRGEPVAIVADGTLNRVYVLQTTGNRSWITVIEPGFLEPRWTFDLNRPGTDLVIGDALGYVPGPDGVEVFDLSLEAAVGRTLIPLDYTGEMAVSPDGEWAMILFQSGQTGGPPGLSVINLRTGGLQEVLQ